MLGGLLTRLYHTFLVFIVRIMIRIIVHRSADCSTSRGGKNELRTLVFKRGNVIVMQELRCGMTDDQGCACRVIL